MIRMVLVSIALLTSWWFKPSPAPKAITTPIYPQWGAYTGDTVDDFNKFKENVPKHLDYLATFVHWGNNNKFPDVVGDLALKEGATLVIFWEAMDYNKPTPNNPNFSYDAIKEGRWDEYIASFAKSAKHYPGEIILIPFEEPNSNWYPWSGTINGNSPALHVAAYRYLRSKFNEVPNVKFGWTVNNESVPDTPENEVKLYYPGDAFVDYVGVNGFNFGDPWQSYGEIFDTTLNQLSNYKKPIVIFSMASAQGPQKPTWIKDTFTAINKDSRVSGWIWFNEKKEKDWRVWSDPESLTNFISALP